jgi:uncharacterized protein (TIGR02996 family)
MAGFLNQSGTIGAMTIEAHLAEIRKNIDDPAPYLVFADWLQEQENPWGRLIVLQHELEQRPGDGAIAAEIEALLKKHRWAPGAKPKLLRLDWRWGFIRAVRVYDEYDHEDVDEVLGPVLDLPMAALIQSCIIFRNERYTNREGAKKKKGALERLPEGATLEQVSPVDLGEDKAPDKNARWVNVQSKFPADIGGFKRAAFLTCHGITSLPKAVGTLPLERLDVDWCWGLSTIPDAVWGIESLGYISMYDCHSLDLNMAQVNNLLLGFVRARTPRKQRVFEAALLRGKTPKATGEQLLFALDNNVKTVRTRAMELLETQLDSPLAAHPIEKGSVVALLGSVNIDKKSLKSRVEGAGATLATKLTKQTTHVLLGEKPKGKQHEIGKLPVLLERHIVAMGPAKKATSKKGAMKGTARATGAAPVAQLARDLRSKDGARVLSAIEALQDHGGIPKELLPELFLVLQDTSLEKKGKGRKLAKKLFAAYAPAKLKNAVAKHMKTSVLLAGETKQTERLTALAKQAGAVIDMRHLARLMVEDFGGDASLDSLGSGCGFQYLLSRGEADEIKWALGKRIKGKRIDLSDLELDTLPDLSGFSLEEVDASNNHLTKFPVELSALPKLKILDLSENYLRSLPRSLKEFTALRTLDLSRNRFMSFPRGAVTFPALRELDLTADTWGETRITKIPKEIVSMKSLEVLKIENGRVAVEIPEEMAAMTWLKQFQVTWEGASDKPPAALKKLLPRCKIC